jgi:hypothetical protein
MRTKMKPDIPFQIENIINSLSNQKENIHLRQNYRQRLVNIQEAIDKALKKYDNELYMANTRKKRA